MEFISLLGNDSYKFQQELKNIGKPVVGSKKTPFYTMLTLALFKSFALLFLQGPCLIFA
jgi:hypothetical protein